MSEFTVLDRGAAINLQPHVEEAIRALGLLSPAAIEPLCRLGQQYYTHGTAKAARETMRLGRPLAADQRKAMGVRSRASFGSEGIALLTERGRALDEPADAFHDTWARAQWNATRQAKLAEMHRRGEPAYLAGYRLMNGTLYACEAANEKTRIRTLYALNELPELPLPGCDRPWCNCSWHPVPKERLPRRRQQI